MKKILVFLLCVALLSAVPVVAFAEEDSSAVVEQDGTVEVVETPDERTATEKITDYLKAHVEEISVIGTLILTIFYEIRKHRKLNGSIGTLNNNAVTVAENSAVAIQSALAKVESVAEVVNGYKEKMEAIIDDIKKNAEEKEALEDTLKQVKAFLNSSKLATLEMSNEVAELLVLANIPNAKKEELYARHIKAVHDLEVVDEVMSDDGSEA